MSSALAPLWAIEDTLLALMESLETCPDELQPELQARIAEYMGQEVAKVDQIAHVLAALEYEAKAAGDEIARLQERKKAAAKAQEKLEKYLCRIITARGSKLIGNTNTLSVRPSDAVVITDERQVPLLFRDATISMLAASAMVILPDITRLGGVITYSTNKADIKKAIKAGSEIPGADLEFRDNLVRK